MSGRPNLADGARVRASGDAVAAELEDEAVLLDVESERYYGLNDAGRFIWRLLEEPRSVKEIRDRLVASYRVAPERAERDLTRFLERLDEHDLVRIEERP